jgi:NADH-quinone oxidoreductase subunit M
MAALGLPGLSGFAGEFLILIGTWQTQPVITALSLIAIVIASAYVLRLFQGAMHGPERAPAGATLGELRPREILVVAPLLAAIVLLGVWPAAITNRMSHPAPAVHRSAEVPRV